LTLPDGGAAAEANSLRLIKLAMAGGVGMLGATVLLFYEKSQRVPTPAELSTL
jgi:hypothetical protein